MMRHLLTFLALVLGLAGPALAQSPVADLTRSDITRGEVARAALIPGWRQADGSHVAGLLIDLAPGWKTYWRSPGDAGIPPRFDWAGSRNVAGLRTLWPTPKAMDQNGMTSIGYPGDVVIPLVIRPDSAGRPITLTGRMELGVCKEVCVPAEVRFSASLTPGGARDPRLVAALVDRPLTTREARVGRVTCRIAPIKGGVALTADIAMPSAGGREYVVVETANPAIWVAEAQTRRTGPVLTARTEMQHVEGAPFALDRAGLRFTVLGSSHAVDIRGCVAG
ncbi:protein-disulfide reductase DsbD domain-containing protein [Marinovum sp.]|uniref:protein-disulfide reductase DsbD domain-containing protein n=1 Tax=Marinovum sp. TaxID=2024839 RepID=UPI002B27B51C|nr:protein-disulfide reductase DsbD domain-containing protein [Marinovum sp.]